MCSRDDADLAAVGADLQARRKALDDVVLARRRDLLERVADELGHVRAGRVHQRDLMLEVLRVAELDASLGDVVEPQVAAVDLIRLIGRDFDRHRHVAKMAADTARSRRPWC